MSFRMYDPTIPIPLYLKDRNALSTTGEMDTLPQVVVDGLGGSRDVWWSCVNAYIALHDINGVAHVCVHINGLCKECNTILSAAWDKITQWLTSALVAILVQYQVVPCWRLDTTLLTVRILGAVAGG